LIESEASIMWIKDRRIRWALVLSGVAVLPVGMVIAVVAALAKGDASPPVPKVVASWASGPMEVRVAFDRAVDPVVAVRAVGRPIRFGDDAAARPSGPGRPGGDGGSVRIAAARLVDAGRTLILTTDPHPREATYTLRVEEIKTPGDVKLGRSAVVTYSLAGVEVTWTLTGEDKPAWAGWWPDLDPSVVRATLAGSVEHDNLWSMLRKPGKLALRSFVSLPPGQSISVIDADAPFEAALGSESSQADAGGHATLKVESGPEPTELNITVTTPPTQPDLTLHWTVAPASAPGGAAQALSRSAFSLPWAPPTTPIPSTPAIPSALAEGGDPARGALIFAGDQAKCANCHQVRGQGGQVGPDLSNLHETSRAWVYHNIMEPSAAIHPDFVTYTVAFKDGRINVGVVRAEAADSIRVGDIDAKFTVFPRAEVEEIRPSASSIMPVGLLGAIGEDQTRDLLAFLTSPTQPPAASPAATPPKTP